MSSESFKMVRESIDLALDEIKIENPMLYEHLKESLIMDEENDTFCYSPKTKSDYYNNQT